MPREGPQTSSFLSSVPPSLRRTTLRGVCHSRRVGSARGAALGDGDRGGAGGASRVCSSATGGLGPPCHAVLQTQTPCVWISSGPNTEHVTLCASPITRETLSLASRNAMSVQPRERLCPWGQDSKHSPARPWQTHISFWPRSSSSVHAALCYTHCSEAAAWEGELAPSSAVQASDLQRTLELTDFHLKPVKFSRSFEKKETRQ